MEEVAPHKRVRVSVRQLEHREVVWPLEVFGDEFMSPFPVVMIDRLSFGEFLHHIVCCRGEPCDSHREGSIN